VNDGAALRCTPAATPQMPAVITLASQEQIAELRANDRFVDILKSGLVRACRDTYTQGG
jgi:hypothetical protein